MLRGLALAPDPDLAVRLRLSGAAWTLEERGVDAARAEVAGLERQAADLGSAELVALCRAQSAVLLLRAGELVAARDLLDRVDDAALADLDRLRVLLNRGTLAAHLAPGAGEDDLWRAHEVAERTGMEEAAFRALHNLGWLAFLRGDLPAALQLMRRADELDADVDRTVALLDRARVQLEAGLVAEAGQVLELAAAGARASGQHHVAGEIDLELARTQVLLGHPAAAVRGYAECRAAFSRLEAPAWADRARLLELSVGLTSGERRDASDNELAALADAARRHGDPAAAVTATLARAELALLAGRADRAHTLLAGLTRTEADRAPYLATRLQVLRVRCRLALAREERRAAGRLLRRASEELARARSRPASLDLRTAVAVHSRELADLDVDLAVGTGRAWSVLAASERWRAAADHLPDVRPARDPAALELLRRLRAAREDLRTAPPGADTRALQAAARRIGQRVRQLDWEHADTAAGAARPLPQRALAAALGEHALVSYLPHGSRLLAVVVPPGEKARLVDLGAAADVRELARRLRAEVTALATAGAPGALLTAVRAALLDTADRTAAALVAPVLARLPADAPLVLVPALDLGNVPWGLLPGTRGRPLTVSRSASAWCHADRRGADAEHPTGAALGALAGPGLPLADREVADVAGVWGAGEVVAADDSGPEALARLLATCRVVHVAAHGTHDHASPLFSSVRTARGPAFAHELQPGAVAARHVVLAACEVGRATFRPGDEPLGLTATLLSLGVTSVVAPTCVVPDEDAHALVVAHHAELAAGADTATALARATLAAPLLAGSLTAYGAPWRPAPGSRPAP